MRLDPSVGGFVEPHQGAKGSSFLVMKWRTNRLGFSMFCLPPSKIKNLKVLGFRVPEKRFFVKLTLNLLNKLVTGWRPHFWKLAPPRDRSSSLKTKAKRKKLRKLKLL